MVPERDVPPFDWTQLRWLVCKSTRYHTFYGFAQARFQASAALLGCYQRLLIVTGVSEQLLVLFLWDRQPTVRNIGEDGRIRGYLLYLWGSHWELRNISATLR